MMSIEWWQIVLGLLGTSGITAVITHLLNRPKTKSDIGEQISKAASNMIAAAELISKGWQQQLTDVQAEVDRLRSEVKKRDCETMTMQAEMTKLQLENANLRQETQSLRSANDRKNRQIDDLNKKVKDLYLILRQHGIAPPEEK